MKRLMIPALLIAMLALQMIATGVSANDGAFHYRAEGLIHQTGYIFVYDVDFVGTPSGIGNATFHGTLVDPSTAPSQAEKYTGFSCITPYGITVDSWLIVTPSGEVSGACKVH